MDKLAEVFIQRGKLLEELQRNELLINNGLYKKVYAPETTKFKTDEYPYIEWSKKQNRFIHYKACAIDVTDEEYEEIKKYFKPQETIENESILFSNVGKKFEVISKIICCIFTIISIYLGIFLLVSAEDNYYFPEILTQLGWLTIILGPFISWLFSLVIYGFGRLIKNSDKLVELNKKSK